jgi:AraC-like DNA-binding protein
MTDLICNNCFKQQKVLKIPNIKTMESYSFQKKAIRDWHTKNTDYTLTIDQVLQRRHKNIKHTRRHINQTYQCVSGADLLRLEPIYDGHSLTCGDAVFIQITFAQTSHLSGDI